MVTKTCRLGGSGDDPGLYSYSSNTMQHGPQTSLQNTPKTHGLKHVLVQVRHNMTGFLTGHHSRPNFTDIPRWVHKERIDVNQICT